MNAVLEVAIGLGFVFLVFSLVASSVVEWVSTLRERRATFLIYSLTATLGPRLTSELLKHPVIAGIPSTSLCPSAPRNTKPSYLSPRSVALALADISRQPIDPESEDLESHKRLGNLVRALRSALEPGGGSAGLAMDSEVLYRVEQWFTEQMKRTTALYKRWTQVWTLVAATLLTLLFDLDAGRIAGHLYANSAVRSALAASVSEQVQGKALADLRVSIEKLDDLPIGWSRTSAELLTGWNGSIAIVGWLISIVAIGMGAPFWFDLLNRLASLRQTGPRPADDGRMMAQ
jgi:hypothetical protein